MQTQQLLVRLPEDLVRRLKRRVSARKRSDFIRQLLEQALPPEADDDDPLYRAALAVENDEALNAEMTAWDITVEDGMDFGSAARIASAVTRSPATPTSPIRRGEIWWVNLDPARGSEIRKTRPAVVLTANALNRVRRTVMVVPLSTGPQPREPIVVTTASAGPGAVAVCDQLRAVDKTRLTQRIGLLSQADLRGVEDGVRAILEL